MSSRVFIVKVGTATHDDDLLDHFPKHVAFKFAGSAYQIIDVQQAVFEDQRGDPEPPVRPHDYTCDNGSGLCTFTEVTGERCDQPEATHA